MTANDRWAARATELPEQARAERERTLWQELVEQGAWQTVVDVGCGAGFHLKLLRSLGVKAVGVDRSLAALVPGPRVVTVGDAQAPPIRPGWADAAICLGNTLSLLPDRQAQRRALGSLASLVRTGGQVLVQGEDVGSLTAAGPILRSRTMPDGRIHLRSFVRSGRRVMMAAGVVPLDGEAVGGAITLLPTSRSLLQRMARRIGLVQLPLGTPPASSPATWWLLWRCGHDEPSAIRSSQGG